MTFFQIPNTENYKMIKTDTEVTMVNYRNDKFIFSPKWVELELDGSKIEELKNICINLK